MRSASILFRQSSQPVRLAITKFCGQPVWIGAPQWPLSRSTGKPMHFIGQVALTQELFKNAHGRMVYIFMSLDQDIEGTSDPDGGENAVVVQPGHFSGPCADRATGPSLEIAKDFFTGPLNRKGRCEFTAELAVIDEPSVPTREEAATLSQEQLRQRYRLLARNKIGGVPFWIQNEAFPFPQAQLVLQLSDSGHVPFFVNFGNGQAYVFVDAQARQGKMLWQC